jgi:large subunit ribosomal protein L18
MRRVKRRRKIFGTSERPRISVYRSLKHIYAQLVDDSVGKTLISFSSSKLKNLNKTEQAKKVGELLAKASLEKGVEKVVFDRGPFKYHGRLKALAEGARAGGLKF